MKHALVVAAISALSAGSVALFLHDPALTPSDARPSAQHPKEVAGLWSRWPSAASDGDRVRFYFFHEKGIGLYRFGKIGLNTTSSFDWRVEGNEIVMTFRKTGEVKRTPYALAEHGQGKPRSLVMSADPKEPLVGAIAYTYVPPSSADLFAADLFGTDGLGDTLFGADAADDDDDDDDDDTDGALSNGIGGRMWIDMTEYATGGSAFAMYQLKDTAIDGRGVGWHHIGDFDDWSTEALAFRFSPASCRDDAHLDLAFSVRGDRASTQVIKKDGALVLVEDPRSFWHVRAYKDGGKSFSLLR